MQSLTVDRRTVSKEMSSTRVRQDVIFVQGIGNLGLKSGTVVSAVNVGKPNAMLIFNISNKKTKTPLNTFDICKKIPQKQSEGTKQT